MSAQTLMYIELTHELTKLGFSVSGNEGKYIGPYLVVRNNTGVWAKVFVSGNSPPIYLVPFTEFEAYPFDFENGFADVAAGVKAVTDWIQHQTLPRKDR